MEQGSRPRWARQLPGPRECADHHTAAAIGL
jgi:hypothetical protein